ncbi:hypothetical protein NBT05_02915 [Aquimarina sp. ERC-38]|uniref:hypothetical protein n=1 Tax=Aquimarina sp. ERC-38 TaxID=2949996 RepID=UPI00224666E8|nr:hypothetical protein [Aquimarina sp. ERC-38]UZO81432.1 hypothetical protein NBT05_02915 [Aquimarina sp. ERC-38]
MKKVFLGLFVAGTMMSFSTTNANSPSSEADFSCCTYEGGRFRIEVCGGGDNCGQSRRLNDLLESLSE